MRKKRKNSQRKEGNKNVEREGKRKMVKAEVGGERRKRTRIV
jgi:hypothetical protein